jgi:hypothetical protein
VKPINGQVRVQLASGQSIFIVTGQPGGAMPAWKFLDSKTEKVAISSTWQVKFIAGGPRLPATRTVDHLTSWTEFGPDAAIFSGTAEYSTKFNLQQKQAGEYVLDLGQVAESARIWINGKDAGIAWSLPFQLRVGKLLQAGENTICIQVANLMANRMKGMDTRGEQWRNYNEINFVNINYKPFDASTWKVMPSGLLSQPTLTAYN